MNIPVGKARANGFNGSQLGLEHNLVHGLLLETKGAADRKRPGNVAGVVRGCLCPGIVHHQIAFLHLISVEFIVERLPVD